MADILNTPTSLTLFFDWLCAGYARYLRGPGDGEHELLNHPTPFSGLLLVVYK